MSIKAKTAKIMKLLCLTSIATTTLLLSCDGQTTSSKTSKTRFDPENELHQVSYVLGREAGRRIKEMEADLDVDLVIMAMKAAINDSPALLSDSALIAIDRRLARERRDRERQRQQNMADANLAAATDFLERNKTAQGVITTESGLQYIILKEGTGPKPGLNDKVRVHYHGTLLDGTVFDSSVDRGEPITFAVTGVIKGWTEVLQLMSVGGKVRAFIPPELAYGRRGARPPIAPNMALIFEIELLAIEK